MKYGKIYTYKDFKEAINMLKKKVVFSDSLRQITEFPETCVRAELKEIVDEGDVEREAFFLNSEDEFYYQFIREIVEEEKPTLMTNKHLAEWLAKGKGEWITAYLVAVRNDFSYAIGTEDSEVNPDFRIRPWGSNEWVLPTVGIYERDCKGKEPWE